MYPHNDDARRCQTIRHGRWWYVSPIERSERFLSRITIAHSIANNIGFGYNLIVTNWRNSSRVFPHCKTELFDAKQSQWGPCSHALTLSFSLFFLVFLCVCVSVSSIDTNHILKKIWRNTIIKRREFQPKLRIRHYNGRRIFVTKK